MSQAVGLALGDDGTLYFADTGNHCIRSVQRGVIDGEEVDVVDTVAGGGLPGYVDGPSDAARFDHPLGLAVIGRALFVADANNDAIRRIDLDTGVVTTAAGAGVRGFSGDGGLAVDAALAGPRGLGAGPDGALYVADSNNHVIRRIDGVDGTIGTVLGVPGESGYTGEGTRPDETLLNWPNDVAVSPDGDLIVADTINTRVRIVRALLVDDG
jgi:sugar lactone lactonase YvrE